MKKRTAILALLTCIFILSGVYLVVNAVQAEQQERHRAEVQSTLSTVTAKLEGGLNSRLFLEKGIMAFVLTHLAIDPDHQITQQQVDNFAKQFMPQLLGIRNITLIQENVITHVYPLVGNEKALGTNLMELPAQKDAVLRVKETGQSVLAGPINLVQGGKGIINRSPIYWLPAGTTKPVYWGQSSLVLMSDDLFREAGLFDYPGLRLAIRGRNGLGDQGEYFWGDEQVFQQDPVIVNVKIPGGCWQLAAVPLEGWGKPTWLSCWIFIIGCVLAISCGALVWFLLRAREAEERLQYIGFHDSLTGLHNRTYFELKVRYFEKNGSRVGLLICDLDGLKMVNDTLGHDSGDQLLIEAAKILRACFNDGDIVARIGGDEFAVIVPDADAYMLKKAKGAILCCINSYNNNKPQVPMSLSIGYSTAADFGVPINDLYKEADNNMYREKLYQSQSVRSALVQTTMKLLEARDFITEGHATRMQDMVTALGKAVGLSEAKLVDLRLLAQFHDIGKVGVPDRILLKQGPLTMEETTEMQRHCDIGYRIAIASADLLPIADWILKHQEWWNGGGYPLKLIGEKIPVECRILAIVDAYDAMTSDRPYRKAISREQAIAELKRCAGTQFDPVLVEQFCNLI